MRVAVLSSVYGGYDQPVAPREQTYPCDWILVSDTDHAVYPWKSIVEPRKGIHPRLAAKVAKCRPDLYADVDVHIWVDASFHIHHPEFVTWCLAHVEDNVIAQIPHPDRRRILDEAHASTGLPKYQDLPMATQAESYLAAGYPYDWGLWATGLIVYRGRSVIGDAWLAEQVRWTYQDQISEPPLLWRHGIRPTDMQGGLLNNPYFAIRGHRDHR
jgi:hypothetical protein